MYDPRNNNPYGGGQGPYGRNQQYSNRSRGLFQQYQYPGPGMTQVTSAQASSLISKVMGLLSIAFVVATIGAFVGANVLSKGGGISFWVIALGGLACLFVLQAVINKPGWNLALLFLFVFLEGMSIGPLMQIYLGDSKLAAILLEAFLITAITSASLGVFAWLSKADFSRLGHYLFVGLILLVVVSLVGIFIPFPSTLVLLITVGAIALFCGFMLYDVHRAKYMPDTVPSAILITVNLFLNILNLFLLILRLLTILQGGGGRRD